MQKNLTVSCVTFEDDDHDLQLHYGNDLIACVKITFDEYGDFKTHCILENDIMTIPFFSAIHATILLNMTVTNIVLSTIMNKWSSNDTHMQDVFMGGIPPLVVNPALYSA